GEKIKISKGDIILLVGIQGSGKTTTAAKLAKYYMKKGLKVGLICADTFRAGAYDQLMQLAEEIKAPFYGNKDEKIALNIINDGIAKFKDKDIIIIDSEGRNKIDEELMREINLIYTEIKPKFIFLVLDATIGQLAKEQALAFKKACNVNGIILTKTDGTAKGGGALAACSEAESPIYFIGTGEHIDDFEEFDPKRFVSKLLGYGDLEGLLEKAQEMRIDEKRIERISKGKFTLDDLYFQINEIMRLGSLAKLTEMLPLGGMRIPKELLEMQDEKLKIYKYIMNSMTKKEKENPEIIDSSRSLRIAKGSGRKPEEVRELLKTYRMIKQLMKEMGDERKISKFFKKFGIGNLKIGM
ncbi:MAG: signal recognition particle protein Srp19, partial [Candidatus Altarchaeaceae archaeon]